jgi:hypothetical protein
VSITALPLGVVSIDVSSTKAGFQSISKCIERIGVSSSSGFVLEGVLLLFVNVKNGVVEEVFMIINCCDVEWRGCGMLG